MTSKAVQGNKKVIMTEAERPKKVREFKAAKSDVRLFITLHVFFGFCAFLCLAYASLIAWEFAATDVNPDDHKHMTRTLTTSLYYPIFYLIGLLASRHYFSKGKIQTALMLSVFIPIAPIGIAAMIWNGF